MNTSLVDLHDILRLVGEPPLRSRVLWASVGNDMVATIDLDNESAWPVVQKLSHILDDLEDGGLTVEPFAEYRNFELDSDIDERRRFRRDQRFEIIQEFVQNTPFCFEKKARTNFIARAILDHDVSRPTVVKLLQDYWRCGMTPNALLPRWDLRGGKGRPRKPSGAKLGRPRLPVPEGMTPPPSGINITADIRRFFAISIDREYAINRRLSLSDAYNRCISTFFAEPTERSRPGQIEFRPREEYAETGWPTLEQFKYWVRKDKNLTAIARQRETPRVFDLKNRGLSGSASAEAWGPGSRFEIDATIADVYLLSRLDRNQIIGRPVIYVVIDVFSRLIVGVYVGLEGPSWAAAMMALANAVEDKQAFCASRGITIEPEEWPAHHLPSILLGDRGELEGNGIAQTLKLFHVTCENAAAYRADWKGTVESRFRILQHAFKPYTPGYVDTDFRARGARDYRLDAVLTLDDFEQIILNLVLYFNNHHELTSFDRHKGMVEDRVRSIPIEMWNWGISSVGGLPRRPAPERVRFALLPRDVASVTDRGIRFQGRYYESAMSRREDWFGKARTTGKRWKVEVGFDKRDVNRIYLADSSTEFGFDVAELTSRSREVEGGSGWEAEAITRVSQAMSRESKQRDDLRRAEMVAENEAVVKAAAKKSASAASKSSDASKVRNIRGNRAQEKGVRREEEASEFRPKALPTQTTAEVHVLRPSGAAARPSYDTLREQSDK